MPNAINKYRPKQLVKVDKENENQVIRRKFKTINKDKLVNARTETVWERLSKMKHCPSSDGSLCDSSKCRFTFFSGSNHRMLPLRSLPPITLGATNKRTLHPNAMPYSTDNRCLPVSATNKNQQISAKLNQHQRRQTPAKKKTEIANNLQEFSNNSSFDFLTKPGQPVKNILTPRSICPSKTSSEDSKSVMELSRLSKASSEVSESFMEMSSSALNDSARSSLYYSQMSDFESSEFNLSEIGCSGRSECSAYSGRHSIQSEPSAQSSAEKQLFRSINQTDTSISHASCEYYELAPLMSVPTRNSLNSSVKIIKNFRGILKQKQKTMPPEELKVIKDVVKSDERHHQLQRDDAQLFKDILKTQLQEILRQELVVKSALNKLDSAASTPKGAMNEPEITEDVPEITLFDKSIVRSMKSAQQKPKVDVIFKNVPTLEKEIIILKALGEKLEATLKRTAMSRDATEQASLKSNCIILPPPSRINMVLQLRQRGWVLAIEHNAQLLVHVSGIRQIMGFVKEFRIAHKTIVELKEDAHRHFYLPFNNENNELWRTSFKKLKKSPDVLMRYLRPKNALVNFNVLEQDPIFFNSFLFNSASGGQQQSEDSTELTSMNEGGDSRQMSLRVALSAHECQCPVLQRQQQVVRPTSIGDANDTCERRKSMISVTTSTMKTETETEKVKQKQKQKEKQQEKPKPPKRKAPASKPECAAPLADKQRQHLRRSRTPMPLGKTLEPKNHLLKTILVGSVQISIFLLLIMAFTYPDAKC